MNCIDFYKDRFNIDISVLPQIESNFIASCYLEHIYFPKEELEEMVLKYLHIENPEKDSKATF
jgi:hypothetical protein